MKKYFITGGFGLLGSALTNAIRDGEITILSRSQKGKQRIEKNDVTVVEKPLEHITEKDIQDNDIIYHFASTVDNYNILTDPYVDVQTNLIGTIKLLESVKNLKKKPRIVYLSTFFVYGNEYDKTNIPINEDSKTDPLALYPATKLCAESIIKLYGKLYDIPYLICRLTNVYGDKEDFSNKKKGAFNYMIMKAIQGEPLQIYRNGDFYRDYIFVDDVVSALQFLEKKQIENDTFLLGFGKAVLFKDLISHLHHLTNEESPIEEIEPPKFHQIVGINNFVADTSKINALGWHATIDYKQGIKKIVDAYSSITK